MYDQELKQGTTFDASRKFWSISFDKFSQIVQQDKEYKGYFNVFKKNIKTGEIEFTGAMGEHSLVFKNFCACFPSFKKWVSRVSTICDNE